MGRLWMGKDIKRKENAIACFKDGYVWEGSEPGVTSEAIGWYGDGKIRRPEVLIVFARYSEGAIHVTRDEAFTPNYTCDDGYVKEGTGDGAWDQIVARYSGSRNGAAAAVALMFFDEQWELNVPSEDDVDETAFGENAAESQGDRSEDDEFSVDGESGDESNSENYGENEETDDVDEDDDVEYEFFEEDNDDDYDGDDEDDGEDDDEDEGDESDDEENDEDEEDDDEEEEPDPEAEADKHIDYVQDRYDFAEQAIRNSAGKVDSRLIEIANNELRIGDRHLESAYNFFNAEMFEESLASANDAHEWVVKAVTTVGTIDPVDEARKKAEAVLDQMDDKYDAADERIKTEGRADDIMMESAGIVMDTAYIILDLARMMFGSGEFESAIAKAGEADAKISEALRLAGIPLTHGEAGS